MTNLESKLKSIGIKLIKDTYKDCGDVVCSRKDGIVPRGLVYESGIKPNSMGVVIVGMNPGEAEEDEKKAMRKDSTYEGFLKYFWDKVSMRAYYERLRELARLLNLKGPIVWTELVKCQSLHRGKLSIPTIRRDVNKYLFKELAHIPKNWPLIGVGGDAYRILSYSFPNRIVIGIPHVKAYGDYFHKLLRPDNKKVFFARRKLQTALKNNNPILIDLFWK